MTLLHIIVVFAASVLALWLLSIFYDFSGKSPERTGVIPAIAVLLIVSVISAVVFWLMP